MRRFPAFGAAAVVLSVAWPLLVWLALGHVGPRALALLLVLLAGARAATSREPAWRLAALAAGVLALVAALADSAMPLRLYPVLVNGAALALFAASLWRGRPIVERIARLREPSLPPAGVAYTRRVTQAWCAFFVGNGAIALATALWADLATWTLWNGLLSYVAMGLFMGAECLVRRRVRARDAGVAHA